MTKKILSASFLLVILFTILLALSGWYFGASAQQTLKTYIEHNSKTGKRSLYLLELISYKKTVFGAKASIKVSSDIPLIAEKLGEIKLNARLLNGPLFVTKNGISTGRFRWFMRVDEASLSGAEKDSFRAIFADTPPYIIVRSDFEGNLHYSAKLPASFARIDMTGIYDLAKNEHNGKLKIKDFHYDFPPTQISAEALDIDYRLTEKHQAVADAAEESLSASTSTSTSTSSSALLSATKTIKASIPHLQLKLNGIKPISLALESNSKISLSAQQLNAFSKVTLKQLGKSDIPVEKANLSLLLKNLSSEGFLRFNQLQAELDNLRQQVQWSLQEKGEYPEGQDQIWQLYNRIDEDSERMPSILLNDLFNKDSLIQFRVEATNHADKSELRGELQSINSDTSAKYIKKGGDGLVTLLSILQGEARVKLKGDLYDYLQKNLPNFLVKSKSEFELLLKDSKLLMR